MAAIRETLSLEDQFSAAFSSYINMAKNASASTKQVQAAAQQAQLSASVLSSAYEVQAARSRAVAAEAEASTKAMQAQGRQATDVGNKFRDAASGANAFTSALKTLISVAAVKSLLNISDQVANVNARLSVVAGPGESVEGLQAAIMASANRSRANYLDTANSISKMGVMAGDAFSGSAELIGFMEAVNKQFVIAGTSAEGIDAAMLQLTQAMSSGVLRGEELNSVFEQAPNIVQNIADYLGVSVGEIREMASEGKITSEVVKNAMLAATDEINEEFENMPRTWAQVWDRVQNDALEAFQPVLDKISDLANSEDMTEALDALQGAMQAAAQAAEWLIDTLVWIKTISEPYADQIGTIALAMLAFKTATMLASIAQGALNAAMAASPITWIILLIVALIATIVLLWDNCEWFRNMWIGAVEGMSGGMVWLYNNAIVPLYNGWLNAQKNMIPGIVDFAKNVTNIYYDMSTGITKSVSNALKGLSGLANAYNSFAENLGLPKIDISGAISAVDAATSFAESQRSTILNSLDAHQSIIENAQELKPIDQDKYQEALNSFKDSAGAFRFSDTFKSIFSDVESAIKEGVDLGAANALGDGTGQYSPTYTDPEANSLLSDIAGNTAGLKKDVSLAQEDVKMLVDMAQREYINNINLQTNAPQITVNATSASGQPIDGKALANKIRDILLQESSASTDKTYSFAF